MWGRQSRSSASTRGSVEGLGKMGLRVYEIDSVSTGKRVHTCFRRIYLDNVVQWSSTKF